MNIMPRETRSYKCVRSPRSNEFDNIDELEKQEMRDERGRITNTYKEYDDEKLVSKGLKGDNDQVIKNGSESNADSGADGVTGVIQIKSPNRNKIKLFKEVDDENLVSKRLKSDNDENINNGSESKADSDADGITGVIQIKSPNRNKIKLFKEVDDENLVSKRLKFDNDEDIKNGSESKADSDADGVTSVIQIKSPNRNKIKLFKEVDDENLESKRLKSDNDEDIKNGSESNADSDADGVTSVIQIKSPNRNKIKLFKEVDDENLVSKRLKSDNDEDIKNGSESNADSDADGVTGVIQIKSPNRKKIKLFKEVDDENLVSKGLKSDNYEDTKNGSESNADSDSDDDTGVMRIENLNRKKLLLQRLSSLNAFIADTSEPVLLSSTHEWEQVEKEPQQQDCQNLHTQGDTEQANSDLATNLAEKAISTKEDNEKSEQEMVKVNVQITQ